MANFTHEEWTRQGFVITAEGRGIVASIPLPQNGGVFDCDANVCLIAAAPEIYGALQLARTYVEAMHLNIASAMGNHRTVIAPDLAKIDAALAKATGGSQ